MLTVAFFTKPNCALCDKALEQIEMARREVQFEFIEVNILSNPGIYEQFKHNIPMGQLYVINILSHRLTCQDLLKRLQQATRP